MIDLPHCFICRDCSNNRGGIETEWVHTVHLADCQYCGAKNVIMVPVRDFKWPKSKSESKRLKTQLKKNKK